MKTFLLSIAVFTIVTTNGLFAQGPQISYGIYELFMNNRMIKGIDELHIGDIGHHEGINWPDVGEISIWTNEQGGENSFKFLTKSAFPFKFTGANVTVDQDLFATNISTNNYLMIGGNAGAKMELSTTNDALCFSNKPIYIGTTNSDLAIAEMLKENKYKLGVNGQLICEGITVLPSNAWPDYVFTTSYKLRSLGELETYIIENKHLPNIPSASEVLTKGISLGKMSNLQMEKIEELTLYLITLNKDYEKVKNENKQLKEKLTELELRLVKLEALISE